MALNLSTIDGKPITGNQARALHQAVSPMRDFIISSVGSAFATPTPTGFSCNVGTGMIVIDGTICENTGTDNDGVQGVTMDKPASGGSGFLVAVANLKTGGFTLVMKPTQTLTTNDLVNMPTGIREVPLYKFSYTTSGITSWIDIRPLTSTTQSVPGMINQFAGSAAPNGWLICDGRSIPIADKPNLFAVIGYKYGGSGDSFNIPNLKGRIPVGFDSAQTEFNTLGEVGGEKSHVLTTQEMPSHTHKMHPSTFVDRQANPATFTSKVAAGNSWMTQAFNVGGVDTETTGGNQAHNNLQPYITVNYIIKY